MKPEMKSFSFEEYRKHHLYSKYLEEFISPVAAVAFIAGSELVYDIISHDLEELANRPKDTHIGELDSSQLVDIMPQQFIMNYDYSFLYYFRSQLISLQNKAQYGNAIIAHSVIEELLLYLIMEQAEFYLTEIEDITEEFEDAEYILSEWAYDIFDDSDILFLYDNNYLNRFHSYHFSHWSENQFYMGEDILG